MLRQRRTEYKVASTKEANESFIDTTTIVPSKNGSGKWILIVLMTLGIFLYVIIPVTFYLCPSVRRHAVFLHYVSLSRNKNLSLPREVGLNCCSHFYIQSDENIELGTWHIPAAEALSRCRNEEEKLKSNEEFSDSRPVFLYLHGNAGTRGGAHRVDLYKVLSQKVNAHVIAFDYRGYGDSTNVNPNQDGVVSDALHIYDWLRQQVEAKRIYVWGHSLGTGVATALVHKLSQKEEVPAGLILEAPFTKLMDAVIHHPLSFFHRYMPYFDFFFTNPIGIETGLFDSISKISHIKSSILILHAEDDAFIPYFQGKKLYERALLRRGNYLTRFVGFESKLGYGHKNIYQDTSLPSILAQFIKDSNIKT